jgi:hypothetical protein
MSSDRDTVNLHLREGFEGDEVEVRVAGQPVLRKSGVKTRMQLGLALMWPLRVSPNSTVLTITLPGRGLQTHIDLPASRPLWVGVSVVPEPHAKGLARLHSVVQAEPLGYV